VAKDNLIDRLRIRAMINLLCINWLICSNDFDLKNKYKVQEMAEKALTFPNGKEVYVWLCP
jgi:hypothetical protein